VQLAGDAVYGGVVHKKEFIGDPLREIEPKDIGRACRLMYITSFLMLLAGLLVRMGVILLIC
jgi:adenosylcobinamide-phosphate synthase